MGNRIAPEPEFTPLHSTTECYIQVNYFGKVVKKSPAWRKLYKVKAVDPTPFLKGRTHVQTMRHGKPVMTLLVTKNFNRLLLHDVPLKMNLAVPKTTNLILRLNRSDTAIVECSLNANLLFGFTREEFLTTRESDHLVFGHQDASALTDPNNLLKTLHIVKRCKNGTSVRVKHTILEVLDMTVLVQQEIDNADDKWWRVLMGCSVLASVATPTLMVTEDHFIQYANHALIEEFDPRVPYYKYLHEFLYCDPNQIQNEQVLTIDEEHYRVNLRNVENMNMLVVSLTNITELVETTKQLQQEKQYLDQIIEQIPIMLYKFRLYNNGTPQFTYATKGCDRIYGLNAEELKTENGTKRILDNIFTEHKKSFLKSGVNSMKTLTPWSWKGKIKVPAGDLWVQGDSVPVKFDEYVEWTGIVRDVTAEQEVQKLREQVLQETARTEAEAEFSAYLAHEVRNPLSGIDSLAQFLQENVVANPLEALGDVHSIQKCVSYIQQILNNTLDLSKLRANQLQREDKVFNVYKLCLECIQLVQKPVALETIVECRDSTLACLGPQLRVQQVLVNLLANACKFTNTGRVVLRASWHKDALHFQVEDTGSGIDPATAFQPYKTHSRNGTGIGLALCRELCTWMNGSINIDTSYISGTRMVVILPFVKHNTPHLKKRVCIIPQTVPASQHCFLVDDSKGARMIFRRRLQRFTTNWSFTEAATGEAAIEMVSTGLKPDIIVVDQHTGPAGGVLKGHEVVRTLRSMGFKGVVIACSGNDIAAVHAGVGTDLIWTKPLPTDAQMLRELDELLNKKKSLIIQRHSIQEPAEGRAGEGFP